MIDRRTFLISGVCGIAATAVLVANGDRMENFILRYRRLKLDKTSPTGKLSTEEMTTILAAAEVLIPTEEKLDYLDDLIKSHVDRQTSHVKGYFKEYRNAAILLDETTSKVVPRGKRFSELSLSDRDKVVDSILWNYRADEALKHRLERILLPKKNLSFRRFVVRDILEAVFKKSPEAAAAIVGYPYYPGVPKDPRAYTRQPQFSHL